MIVFSYIDPRIIASTLYALYILISLTSLLTLLIYLPYYLKKDEKKIDYKYKKTNYLEKLNSQLEHANNSKYFRAIIYQLIAKCFAFKSGYYIVNLSDLIQLLKEDKIEIPSDVKNSILESIKFYSSFTDRTDYSDYKNSYLKFIKDILTNPFKNERRHSHAKKLEDSINLVYKKLYEE